MVLRVFVDESGDEKGRRVSAVAGVIGSDEEWSAAESAWVSRTRGKIFHAAECESKHSGRPKSHAHRESLNLYRDLTQITAGSPVAGIGVALDLTAHRELFGPGPRGLGYFKCLSDILEQLTALSAEFSAQVPSSTHPRDEPVSLEFTLDSREESNRVADSLYSAFVSQPEVKARFEHLAGSKFLFDSRANPRIQMADLLARETMKELDRRITGIPPRPRASYAALCQANKFIFLFRDRAYCREWRRNKDAIEEHWQMSPRDYAAWLVRTGRFQNGRAHDNMKNRFDYMMWKMRPDRK